jgi:hypothetical protein
MQLALELGPGVLCSDVLLALSRLPSTPLFAVLGARPGRLSGKVEELSRLLQVRERTKEMGARVSLFFHHPGPKESASWKEVNLPALNASSRLSCLCSLFPLSFARSPLSCRRTPEPGGRPGSLTVSLPGRPHHCGRRVSSLHPTAHAQPAALGCP